MPVTAVTPPTQPWASSTDTSSGFNPKKWTEEELLSDPWKKAQGLLFDTGAFERQKAESARAAALQVAGIQQAQLRANALLPGGGARDLQTRELAEASAEAGAAGASQAFEVEKIAEEKKIARVTAKQEAEEADKKRRRQIILKVGATIGAAALTAVLPAVGAPLLAAITAIPVSEGGAAVEEEEEEGTAVELDPEDIVEGTEALREVWAAKTADKERADAIFNRPSDTSQMF